MGPGVRSDWLSAQATFHHRLRGICYLRTSRMPQATCDTFAIRLHRLCKARDARRDSVPVSETHPNGQRPVCSGSRALQQVPWERLGLRFASARSHMHNTMMARDDTVSRFPATAATGKPRLEMRHHGGLWVGDVSKSQPTTA